MVHAIIQLFTKKFTAHLSGNGILYNGSTAGERREKQKNIMRSESLCWHVQKHGIVLICFIFTVRAARTRFPRFGEKQNNFKWHFLSHVPVRPCDSFGNKKTEKLGGIRPAGTA
jgi:hypothetical protein